LEPLSEFDRRLSLLSQSMPVIVLPGPLDPTCCALPQAPLKRVLLPLSSKTENTNLLGNPSTVSLDGTDFLVAAGQNVDDMVRYSKNPDPLKMAELILNARHIAPSAPDTLCTVEFLLLTSRVLSLL
jgi:DNA polymerase delta subunit 2